MKRKRRHKKRALVLIVEIILLVMLAGTMFVMAKYDKFQKIAVNEEDIETNDGMKKEGYTTVALFGGDSRDGQLEAGTHADTIMVAALNNKTKEIRLVSVYRDTLTRQADGSLKKANNAYFSGGPTEAINLLNRNFDLDVEDYVTVDFKALADTVDLIGGIELSPTQEEVDCMNEYLQETANVAGKEANFVERAGQQTFDGVQAVTYARIRKIAGGDYKRAERQRLVLERIFEKVKGLSLTRLNELIDTILPSVSTSFSLTELIGLASQAPKYQLGEMQGFPYRTVDKTMQDTGSIVVPTGVLDNVEDLHKFLYPDENYEVSQTVQDIALEIENYTGITKDDYEEGEVILSE